MFTDMAGLLENVSTRSTTHLQLQTCYVKWSRVHKLNMYLNDNVFSEFMFLWKHVKAFEALFVLSSKQLQDQTVT